MQIVGAGVPDKPLAVMHAPLTVLPTPFPEKSFRKAVGSMRAFNTLIDNVSRDDEYLQSTLRPAAEYDEFTVSRSACRAHSPTSWACMFPPDAILLAGVHACTPASETHIVTLIAFACCLSPSLSSLAPRHQLRLAIVCLYLMLEPCKHKDTLRLATSTCNVRNICWPWSSPTVNMLHALPLHHDSATGPPVLIYTVCWPYCIPPVVRPPHTACYLCSMTLHK